MPMPVTSRLNPGVADDGDERWFCSTCAFCRPA